jgi:predicted ATPase
MSGSGADIGYDYQANAIAYIAAHALNEQPLGWFDGIMDVASSWGAETDGPGDDIAITTLAGKKIEIQAKHRLKRGPEYIDTFRVFFNGLRADPELRVVLFVDHHGSDNILTDLKVDIERLGQGRLDGLKQITLDLLQELKEEPEPSRFARCRIVVVDLDSGSDGAATARSLLSRIVPAARSQAAYDLLGKRGHSLIKNRGQDDTLHCARYLDSALGLLPSAPLSAVSLARFAALTRETNGHFYSPALQTRLPVTIAWSTLRQFDQDQHRNGASRPGGDLEAELKRYQEWSRLASSSGAERQIEADLLMDGQRQLVILGGPGSGKTTLSKKLAYLASLDHIALRVRLPLIAALCRDGSTFESALVEVVVDSSTFSKEEGKRIAHAAEYLIADGLDECDPTRGDIAEALLKWSRSHPQMRICVLTRPVGHSPALLPGFTHAELLPLGDQEIRKISSDLIRAVLKDELNSQEWLKVFIEQVSPKWSNNAASIAARNPLLLSFLVRLFLDRESLAGNRAALFGRIIELIRRSSPNDRLPSSSAALDYGAAWTAAEVMGWSTIEVPERSLAEIYEEIGNHLGPWTRNLRTAESAVSLWSDHGLIERVTVGSRDAIVFVHLSLGEYLAARFLSHASVEIMEREIVRFRRKAKWREPILLAAGLGRGERIVRLLLTLDVPDDPQSIEAVLAAACLAEAGPDTSMIGISEEVAERLKARLGSPIPLIALEAGEALLRIAPLIPDFVAQLSLDLWDHNQYWTRQAAILPGLASGSLIIPIDRIRRWILESCAESAHSDEEQRNSWRDSNSRSLESAAIPQALKRIASEIPEQEAENLTVTLLTKGHVSLNTFIAVEKIFSDTPVNAWVQKAHSSMMESAIRQTSFAGLTVEGLMSGQSRFERAENVLFRSIASVCEYQQFEPVEETEERYAEIGKLLSSMGFWEMGMDDVLALDEETSDQLTEVIRGFMAGLTVDKRRLKFEAESLMQLSSETGGRLLKITRNEREPDFEQAARFPLSISLLTQALDHPSDLVALNASRLLEARSLNEEERLLIRAGFFASEHNLHLYGSLAGKIWNEDAFEILRERVTIEKGAVCGDLYSWLLRSALTEEQRNSALQIVLDGLGSIHPSVAEKAAKALRDADAESLVPRCSELWAMLQHWRTRGSWCGRCKRTVTGSSCTQCHIVPPDPRGDLIFVLARGNCIEIEELLIISVQKDSPEAREARYGVVQKALIDEQVLEMVVNRIDSAASAELFDALLGQAGPKLPWLSESLRRLAKSSSPVIRARVIASLVDRWTTPEEAREIAENALHDEAPNVRSTAVKSLRELVPQ